ncbi:MAG: SDR family oxidoreductase [Anaerolineaceae bacterium]|nr:SDR family oxidoreductase [Anaerolineaceae bacterium]
MSEIQNKVAVVTGGGTGIGASTAEQLAEAGMKVVIVGRRADPLHDVADRIKSRGGEAVAFPADISDYSAMEALCQVTLERFGRVDLLVPNAALHDASSLDSGDPRWWRKVIEVNVIGLMNTVRAFLPQMYSQGSGHIIVISSLSGRVTYVGEPIYITSKHAQVAFVECIRKEVTSRGIKVTIIEPGLVETPFIDNSFAREVKKTVTPLEAVDVARVVRFVYEQPQNVTVYELSMRPLKQLL